MDFTIQEDIKRAKQIWSIFLPPHFVPSAFIEIVCVGEGPSRLIPPKVVQSFGYPRVGDYVFFDVDDEIIMIVSYEVYEYLKSKLGLKI